MSNLARASAFMALGTVVSRATGFLRLLLLFAVIGRLLDADLFNTANTVPNAVYILVAGGVFNVVLVPQLVRAMRSHDDGGDAFAQRIITLGLLALAGATVLLMALVPLVMRLVFPGRLFTPELAVQRDSAELLMLLCLPQVFFYGAFVLIGQVLNAHERFGPMMWAPIANNLVACGVLGVYALTYGTSNGEDGFTTGQAWLLGAGSTAAIAVQALLLVPFLRATGFTMRLRFDFRGVGLGQTFRLGLWTLAFIAVNQVAFIVITRLGTGATLKGAADGTDASGSAVYEFGYLVSQLPHGVITVSLATALMPTLAALSHDGHTAQFRLEIARTLRIALVLVLPLAVAVACLGGPLGTVAGVVGSLRGNTETIGHTIAAFSVAMVAFTAHYLVLRGFYAAEDTRTPFFIQVVIAAVNVAAALFLTHGAHPGDVAWRLALAYGIAYIVGLALSATLLSRRIGPVVDHETVRFLVRMALACGLSAAVMLGSRMLAGRFVDLSMPVGGLGTAFGAGLLGALVFLLATRLFRIRELDHLVRSVTRRG